ncbi:MAG TPA: hypothetical protein VEC16_00270 [Alphaproteobacteria bacterium]|nr:hypothetical protein [Alphaproteobacteria bacterium]
MKKNYSDGNIIFTLASKQFDYSMKKDIIMSDYSKDKDIIRSWGGGGNQSSKYSVGGRDGPYSGKGTVTIITAKTLDSIINGGGSITASQKEIIEIGKEAERIKEVVGYVGRVQALLDYARETLALAKTYSKAPRIAIGKIAPIITTGESNIIIQGKSEEDIGYRTKEMNPKTKEIVSPESNGKETV